MRRILTIVALLACVQAFGQLTPAEYKEKYDRQVRNVGPCGVGVETVLDNWESVAPDDIDMRMGRFLFYLSKSQTTEMVPMAKTRYLGAAPSVTLKDKDGSPVNYFEDVLYDDACFAESQKVIDALIADHPYDLKFRCTKIASLLAYEKEIPDETTDQIRKMISMHSQKNTKWTFEGETVTPEEFSDIIQQYCASLFAIRSDVAYEAFRIISVDMTKLFPKQPEFLTNQGSYSLVFEKNYKKAINFYNKALKLDPEDEAALKNRKIAENLQKSSAKK